MNEKEPEKYNWSADIFLIGMVIICLSWLVYSAFFDKSEDSIRAFIINVATVLQALSGGN